MRRYIIYALYILLAILLVSWQLVGINSWEPGYRHLNVVLLAVMIFWLSFDLRRGIIMAAVSGLVLDALSFEIFGAYTISLIAAVILADFLSNKWLSNRSIYSLWVLSLFGVVVYNFCLYLLFYLGRASASGSFFLFNGNFWLGLLWELVWSAIIIFFFLLFFSAKIPKLRPVFLERK